MFKSSRPCKKMILDEQVEDASKTDESIVI